MTPRFIARMVFWRVAREAFLAAGAITLAAAGWLDRHPIRRLI